MRNQQGCGCCKAMSIILGLVFIVLPILTWLELFVELSMPMWLGIVLIVLGIIGLICGFVGMGKGKCEKPEKEEPEAPSTPEEPVSEAPAQEEQKQE